jgi:hypothetical protein
MVSERAAAAGLPEAKKNEMTRSFQDLSNIMPPEDAWKVVSLRIRDQAAR